VCPQIWWVFVAASLLSAGEISTTDLAAEVDAGLEYLQTRYNMSDSNITSLLNLNGLNATKYVKDMPVMNYLIIYHFFGLLWTTQFLQGIAAMTVAGAVCGWYFSQNETKDPEMDKFVYKPSRFPVAAALRRVIKYYMGSVAFGSLLIAFIQFIRAVMAYVQRRFKDQAKNSQLIKFVFCCIQCCLKCLQAVSAAPGCVRSRARV
jgi:choline transporter-like protein 2/4/5